MALSSAAKHAVLAKLVAKYKPPVAAPAPRPATTSVAQGVGVDPQYEASIASAIRNRDTTLQQTQAAMGQLGQTYGLGVDAAGSVFDDPTNPYSQAAALATAYRQRTAGNETSYAARGQLYSGALQNAQNETTHQNLAGRDALIRNFMAARTGLSNAATAASNTYADSVGAAESDRVMRALAARPDPSTVPQAGPSSQDLANSAHGGAPKITANYKSPSGVRGTLKRYPDGYTVFVHG